MKNKTIALVGLGYVGLPIAVAFAEAGSKVIGFDLNKNKIDLYQKGIDPTHEVGDDRLKKVSNLFFTSDENDLKKADFIIVAVPTPVKKDKTPDLEPLISASTIVGRQIKKGDIVVFESTVYPGVTEDVCIPLISKYSNLTPVMEFSYGYSPERINPGDHLHRLENITKVVSGCDEKTLFEIASTYEIVVKAGVFKATSIKVAEAAKVIENAQRDINIAFMNELALIFDKLDIDTQDVLEAAKTKWNFLPFKPGLVGGHCIGIDPYYLTYKAESVGYHPQVILAGRRINDDMGAYIAQKTVKKMIAHGIPIKHAHVLVMGLTFKEDCPDLRNSKVVDIINELKEYGIKVSVTDPLADSKEAVHEYGITLSNLDGISDVDAIILAVSHQAYAQLSWDDLASLYHKDLNKYLLIDVKSMKNNKDVPNTFDLWRL